MSIKMTYTLSRYLAARYVVNLATLLFGLLAIIYLFDTVELIRRASKHDDVSLLLVIQMGLLKLPEVGQIMLPFAVLFSGMFTFWQLTRKYELIVVRASGFSIWQFLLPIASVAVLFGALQMIAINPIGAVLIGKFEELERVHLKRQTNDIALFREGLWLKQDVMIASDSRTDVQDENQTPHEKALTSGYIILNAKGVQQAQWVLQNVSVLYFTDDDKFLQRVDAKTATLNKGFWILQDVTIHRGQRSTETLDSYRVPTILTLEEIEDSFASPESISFWNMPDYIETLEQTGFDSTKLKVSYHNLIAQPLMYCAMILLAAAVSMRPPRSSGTFSMIATGVMIGFIIFFMSSFMQALGASQQIPVILSAWAPALIAFLLGLSVMMVVEDG